MARRLKDRDALQALITAKLSDYCTCLDNDAKEILAADILDIIEEEG